MLTDQHFNVEIGKNYYNKKVPCYAISIFDVISEPIKLYVLCILFYVYFYSLIYMLVDVVVMSKGTRGARYVCNSLHIYRLRKSL